MTCIVKYDLPHKGRYTDSIYHTWACVKIAQREQKLATRNHRQVSKINARKSSRLLRFIPVSSGHSILAPSVKKKRKTDAIQIYSWHASTILYDRQQDKVIESCQVFFAYRVKHHARNFPPSLDLLIALIMYLSTDAKPRRASLPPALSSWRAFGL